MVHKKSSAKGFALGVLAGSLLGSATALLFAPKPGRKMRKELAKSYHRVSEEAHDLMESVCDTSIELAEKAKEISENAEAVARSYKKKLR